MKNEKFLSIIKRLNKGEHANEIIKSEQMFISDSTLRKKLNKEGYCYNKKLGLWYDKNNKDLEQFIKLSVEHDYLEEMEDLYTKRYLVEEFWDEQTECLEINIQEKLIEEIRKKAFEMGLELDFLIELVFLRFLSENHPRKSLNKYWKLIAYFDPEETPLEEMEKNIKRYETDIEYRKEIDGELEELDKEYLEEFGEKFGLDIKNIMDCEYEYKKKWHERDRHKE